MSANNSCLDPSSLTPASFTALDNANLQDLANQLQDPQSNASRCVPGPFMAARAQLWVANNLTPPSVAPVPTSRSLVEMYEWFRGNDVRVINESWGVSRNLETNQSVIVDYYARKHGLNIVQASANLSGPGSNQLQVSCKGLNSICVGSLQPRPNVGTDVNAWVGAQGLTTPSGAPAGWELGLSNGLDRQVGTPLRPVTSKPDLMSSGVFTDVAAYLERFRSTGVDDTFAVDVPTTAGTVTVDLWRQESGSSFAAPVVAAAIALHGEQCSSGVPAPHVVKARLKTAMAFHPETGREENTSYIVNGTWFQPVCTPMGTNTPSFPTTQQCDFKGGVGGIFAGALRARGGVDYPGCQESSICPPPGGGPGGGFQSVDDYSPFDLDGNAPLTASQREPVTAGETDEVVGIFGLGAENEGMEIPSSSMPADPRLTGKVGSVVRTFDAPNGFWVRSTLAYYSCPPETPSAIVEREMEAANPADHDLGALLSTSYGVAVDFDLALVAKVSRSDPDFIPLALAAAPNEVTEGLQYDTSDAYEVVELWVVGPSGASPCGSEFNPGGVVGEPYAVTSRVVRY
jgi:hypothetical protein